MFKSINLKSAPYFNFVLSLIAIVVLLTSFYVPHLRANDQQLTLNLAAIKINQKNLLVLDFKNEDGWHTYWEFAGDAGLPIENSFSINGKSVKLQALPWPVPYRFIENGNQWAYGQKNRYFFFYDFGQQALDKNIELESKWLICKNICIPGQKKISFNYKSLLEKSNPPLDILQQAFSKLPITITSDLIKKYQPKIEIYYTKKDKILLLKSSFPLISKQEIFNQQNLIYPYKAKDSLIHFLHEKIEVSQPNFITSYIELEWDGEYSNPPMEFPLNGNLKNPIKIKLLWADPALDRALIIEKSITKILPYEPKHPVFEQASTDEIPKNEYNQLASLNPEKKNALTQQSFLMTLFFAFLGGLILNIMPCVLPVISIKLFGLLKYQNASRIKILRHNFFYTLGISSTFMLLAVVIVVLKQIGTQVGWGFQLQSPHFVGLMIVALFIFSLNMFGLFEFSTPGGRQLGQVQTKDDYWGDFLSGVLATVLSTPCSAPFLGTALTYAFTSDTLTTFILFLAISLGLAFPFILTAIFPNLVLFLPKPGHWMNHFKKFLALSLFLTVIWLIDVYISLTVGGIHLKVLLTSLLFIFSMLYFIKKNRKWTYFFLILSITSITSLIFIPMQNESYSDQRPSALLKEKNNGELKWAAWSENKIEQLKSNQKPIFVDFTAKWCFTCKVNEKLVLETKGFKEIVDKHQLQLVLADWTKRDAPIENFLRSKGLVGVPAYFIYDKNGKEHSLGETISLTKIREILEQP